MYLLFISFIYHEGKLADVHSPPVHPTKVAAKKNIITNHYNTSNILQLFLFLRNLLWINMLQTHFQSGLHFKDSRTAISCTHRVPHHIVTELQPIPVSIPPPPLHRNIHSSHFRQYSPLLWLLQIFDNIWQFLAECYLKSETDWFIFLSYFKSQLGRRLTGTGQVTDCWKGVSPDLSQQRQCGTNNILLHDRNQYDIQTR